MRRVSFLGCISLLLTASLPPMAGNRTALTPTRIIQMIRAEWKSAGVIPSPPADDAQYLRRVTIDITGNIPTEAAVRAFLADRSPDKRARAVDALLASDGYVTKWTNYWDQVLLGRQVRAQVVDRLTWRAWLKGEFQHNVPFNRFAYDLITASGVNSPGASVARVAGLAGRPRMRAMEMESETAANLPAGAKINGATNFYMKFAQTPADFSGTVSKVFLGVQIQCAQCHDHKTEKWKQEDFRKFTACFMSARPQPVGQYTKGKSRQFNLVDAGNNRRQAARMNKAAAARSEYLEVRPAALDGTDFSSSPNRRKALAEWMTAPENPYFAQAIVNRMWAHFMGRGFVEPIDDFRNTNPAVMPELLKLISTDFVETGYDLKQLIRKICATEAYQLSARPAPKNPPDNKLWARFRLKAMGPEEILDSLVTATGIGPSLDRTAGGGIELVKAQMVKQLSFLFDVDEEFEQKEFEGTIPQALLMLNGSITNRSVSRIPGNALDSIMRMSGSDADRVTSLYLRTLARMPSAPELAKWVKFVNSRRDVIMTGDSSEPSGALTQQERRAMLRQKAANKRGVSGPDIFARVATSSEQPTARLQAYEDLFWVLLNSSEFAFNH